MESFFFFLSIHLLFPFLKKNPVLNNLMTVSESMKLKWRGKKWRWMSTGKMMMMKK